MCLCINPQCHKPQNTSQELFCLNCGSQLLIQGRYRVVKKLAIGGFGEAYEVEDENRDIVNSKLLNNQQLNNQLNNQQSGRQSFFLKVLTNNQPKAIELFQQEAEILRSFNHPGIPKVNADGYFKYFPRNNQDGLHCLVMEKILGVDLQEYIEKRDFSPIDQALAIKWLTELVVIIKEVHKKNMFHRDIKPSNIMLRLTGELVLIDFGTVRFISQTVIKQYGRVTGVVSAGYTPLEQINNNAIPQSDFYALGRTFVFLLTGKEPIDPEVYDHNQDESRWRRLRPDILAELANLIDEMMAEKPKDRPANAGIILQRLAKIDKEFQRVQKKGQKGQKGQKGNNGQKGAIAAQQPTNSKLANIQPVGLGFWLKWVTVTTVGAPLIWFPLGFFQWRMLKRVGYPAGWWVLVTPIGCFGGLAVGSLAGYSIGGFLAGAAVFGAIVGIMQWLVLRRLVKNADFWVWINAASAAISLSVGIAQGGFIGFIISFGLFGALTGTALIWLLKRPI
jgi:serine/threonine protein kinase